MAPKTDRRHAKFSRLVSSFRCCLADYDPTFVGVVTCRTRDTPPRHKRQDYEEPFFCRLYVLQGLCRWCYKKMLVKKVTWHGRVTAPAQKTDVSSECHVIRPVYCRVRLFRMAHEAYRFAVHLFNITTSIQHFMGIKGGVSLFDMTFKTNHPPVSIGPSPQEFPSSFMLWSAVNFMTGQAPDLASEQGQRNAG